MGTYAKVFETLLTSQRASGVTLSGGKVHFYVPGSVTTYKAIYADRGKQTPAANPYTLSADGTASIYGDGLYDVILKTAAGATVTTWEDVSLVDISGDETSIANYADLAAAVAAIGSTKTTMVVSTDQAVTADLTVPSTMALKLVNEAKITVSSGKVLTINGPFDAPAVQAFAGTGTVVFGQGSTDRIYPQWWGAKGDGTNDDTSAVQSALNAAFGSFITYYAPAGVYKITASITPTLANMRGASNSPGGSIMSGAGMGATQYLYTPTSGIAFNFTVNQNHVDSILCQDFAIRINDPTGASSASCMKLPQGGGQRFHRVHFDGAGATGGIGLDLDGLYNSGLYSYHVVVSECRFANGAGQNTWINANGVLDLVIDKCFMSVLTGDYGIRVDNCRSVCIENNQLETYHSVAVIPTQHLIYATDTFVMDVRDNWFEGASHVSCFRIGAGCRGVQVNRSYYYHDNSATGSLIYNECDENVTVDTLVYQNVSNVEAPVAAGTRPILYTLSSDSIVFRGTYTRLYDNGKQLGAHYGFDNQQTVLASAAPSIAAGFYLPSQGQYLVSVTVESADGVNRAAQSFYVSLLGADPYAAEIMPVANTYTIVITTGTPDTGVISNVPVLNAIGANKPTAISVAYVANTQFSIGATVPINTDWTFRCKVTAI